jgi:type VI protein secretion system component VasF
MPADAKATTKALMKRLTLEPAVLAWVMAVLLAVGMAVLIGQQQRLHHQVQQLQSAISASNQDRVEIHRELAGKIDQ